jgi:hypothetical protein
MQYFVVAYILARQAHALARNSHLQILAREERASQPAQRRRLRRPLLLNFAEPGLSAW